MITPHFQTQSKSTQNWLGLTQNWLGLTQNWLGLT
jgi:hypothetical protein